MSIQNTMKEFMDSVKSKLGMSKGYELGYGGNDGGLTPSERDYRDSVSLAEYRSRNEPPIPVDPNIHGKPGTKAYENIQRMNMRNGFEPNPTKDEIEEAIEKRDELRNEMNINEISNELSNILESDRIEQELKSYSEEDINMLNELRADVGDVPIQPKPEPDINDDRKKKLRNS